MTQPSTKLPNFDRIVVTLLLITAQATNLKAANIQVFEALTLVLSPYLILRHRGHMTKPALLLFGPLMVFFFFSAFYSRIAIDFFPPQGIDLLKQPLIISLVRLTQFSLVFLAFNYLWNLSEEEGFFTWAAARYVDISYWLAVATIACYLFAKATGRILPLVYDTASYLASDGDPYGKLRARGLFVEGGPYGLSLIASLILAILLWRKRVGIKLHQIGILFLAVLLAQSKAAFLCVGLLFGLYFIRFLRLRTFFIALGVCAIAAITTSFLNWSVIDDFEGYEQSIQAIAEGTAMLDPDDGNTAYGRIAAIFIAPRMAAANPLLGVGLGNYSLTRNNPMYLGPMPKVDGWDLPGLGIVTLILEGGFVGLFLMLLSYWLFYRCSLGRAGRSGMGFLFLCPLLLQISGVQLYFAYHWLFLLLLAGIIFEAGEPSPESAERDVGPNPLIV